MITGLIAGLIVLTLAALAYVVLTRHRTPQLPRGTSVHYTDHVRDRMTERGVTEKEIIAALVHPQDPKRDPKQNSVCFKRDFGNRILKVWVADPWPSSEIVLKSTAWRYYQNFSIPTEARGAVIGREGRTIQQIQNDTGTRVYIKPDNTIRITADTAEAAQEAKRRVMEVAVQARGRRAA